MDGYRFETRFISPTAKPSPGVLAGAVRDQLAARRFDLLHIHGEVAAALCLPSLALRPSVVTINGLHLVRRLAGWRRDVAELSLRLVARAASRTICVGEAELAEVKRLVGAKERLVLVHNGVDLAPRPTSEERAAARVALKLPPSVTVGLYLGALDPHKEPALVARAALDAARAGAPIVLLLAGDGPERQKLEALVGASSAVRLLGFQVDVRSVLAAADFFVLASDREGLSFSLLEAMSLGLAPVVSDAPGNPDAVGDAGFVVPRGDVAGFRAAFERMAVDESERIQLGDQARRRVVERFDSAQMLARTRDVYDDVLRSVR
jgi:glycosyltransferase involved in cell wall biosynthesis